MTKHPLLATSVGAALALATVGASAADAADASVVPIPDPALADVLNEILEQPAGTPITQDDLDTIYSIEAPGAGITDLTGLERASTLRWVWLADNGITDFSALAGPRGVEVLDLSGNPISKIPDLTDFTKLWSLSIMDAQIDDLAPLTSAQRLDWVDFSGNPVTDVSSLSGSSMVVVVDNARVRDLTSVQKVYSSSFFDQRIDGGTAYVPVGATSFTHAPDLPVYFDGERMLPGEDADATVDGETITWGSVGATLSFDFFEDRLNKQWSSGFSGTISYQVVRADLSRSTTAPAVVGTESTALSLRATEGFQVAEHLLVAGEVPGMTLDPVTGELSGTPTVAGTFLLAVAAVDAWGNAIPAELSVTVTRDETAAPEETAPPEGSEGPGTETGTTAGPEVTEDDAAETSPGGPPVPGPSGLPQPVSGVAGTGGTALTSEADSRAARAGGGGHLAATGARVPGTGILAGLMLATGLVLVTRRHRVQH